MTADSSLEPVPELFGLLGEREVLIHTVLRWMPIAARSHTLFCRPLQKVTWQKLGDPLIKRLLAGHITIGQIFRQDRLVELDVECVGGHKAFNFGSKQQLMVGA